MNCPGAISTDQHGWSTSTSSMFPRGSCNHHGSIRWRTDLSRRPRTTYHPRDFAGTGTFLARPPRKSDGDAVALTDLLRLTCFARIRGMRTWSALLGSIPRSSTCSNGGPGCAALGRPELPAAACAAAPAESTTRSPIIVLTTSYIIAIADGRPTGNPRAGPGSAARSRWRAQPEDSTMSADGFEPRTR